MKDAGNQEYKIKDQKKCHLFYVYPCTLYSLHIQVSGLFSDPAGLNIPGIRDRAYVYINSRYSSRSTLFYIFNISSFNCKGENALVKLCDKFSSKEKGGIYSLPPPLILVPTKSLFSVHLKGILSAVFCSESKIWNCWKDKVEFKIYKSLLCQLILPAITQTLNPGKKSFEKVLKTWKQISKGFDLVDLIGEQFGSLTNQINDYEFSSFEPIWI